MKINSINIAKYILYKCSFYGDLVTNLKMQKLLYFVYAWHLVKIGEPIFEEKFQAWPNGPVLASVYQELKCFGSLPIDIEFAEIESEEDYSLIVKSLGDKLELIDEVYEKYAPLSAFELVNITHEELAWQNARKDLDPAAPSNNELSDEDILEQYEKK